MSTPTFPGFFTDETAVVAVAPPAVRMAPAAIQARRATAPRVVAQPTDGMRAYRDGLLAIEPATDHAVSAHLRQRHGITNPEDMRFGLTTMNGRRNDWLELDPTCIEAVGRVKVGRAWRTQWRVRRGSVADPRRLGAMS